MHADPYNNMKINLKNEKGEKKPSFRNSSKFKVGSLATTAVTCIKSKEDKYRFKVQFRNELNVPITIFWIDYKGKEVQKKSKVQPGDSYTTHSFFTHPWVFRKSEGEENEKLLAEGNNIRGTVFEGEKFIAIPNEKIEVVILESK